MKIASFLVDNKLKVGIVDNKNVIDISPLYDDVTQIILGGEQALQRIDDYIKEENRTEFSLSDVALQAPFQKINRNIICIGWNYLAHFYERHDESTELPEHPTVFTKASNALAGPYDDIEVDPSFTEMLDYEAELAVIISKTGKNISVAEANDYIFGYAAANDLSARDVQFAHGGQFFMGKSMDQSCPIGPYIVTKEALENVQNLNISCYVNDLKVQESNTRLMIFPIKKIIAELSKGMTLEAGDIILTGTPSGVGWKRNPPLYLKNNDTVTVQIEDIGTITNKIKFSSK